MSREMDDAPTALVLIAGLVREDFPWLAELLTEAYREIRDGGVEKAEHVLNRLRRSIKYLSRGGMMREMMGTSKDAMMMMEELPMFLDMTLHRIVELSDQGKVVEEKASEE